MEVSGGTSDRMHVFLKPPVLEYLKKIGADILKIKFNNTAISETDFLEVMKTMQEIRELEISKIKFTETDHDKGVDHFELKHLTKLEISESAGLNFGFGFVPASLKFLKISYVWDHELLDAELLGKQKGLEELSLYCCKMDAFKFDPENRHIKKLTISYPDFSNDRASKKLREFIKIQESVVEFELAISQEEMEDQNYAEILTTQLSLKSLKKFSFDCYYQKEVLEVFSRLKVNNPVVESLTIKNPHQQADLESFLKLFPNVTDLKITWPNIGIFRTYISRHISVEEISVDLEPINSMKMVRKLEMEYASNEMLAQLELKEMRELHVTEIIFMDGEEPNDEVSLENWSTFIDNNSKLEVLHLPKSKQSVEQLQCTLKNLPLLKSLESTVCGCDMGLLSDSSAVSEEEYMKEQAEKVARLIGEIYDRFEHFHLDFEDEVMRTCVLNYLAEHYPEVKLNK